MPPEWVVELGIGGGRPPVGVYRPGEQNFYRIGFAQPTKFGNPGDVPIVGDWNGNGADELGVYRPNNQTFYPYKG